MRSLLEEIRPIYILQVHFYHFETGLSVICSFNWFQECRSSVYFRHAIL